MQSYVKDRSIYYSMAVWTEASDPAGADVPKRSTRVEKLSRTRTGVSNPGYKSQIRKHTNATTNMGGVFTSLRSGKSMIFERHLRPNAAQPWVQKPDGYSKAWGDLAAFQLPGNFNPADSANGEAYQRAAASAFQAIRSAQVAVSGPTFIGEARETMRMLRKPAEGLRNIAKDWLDYLKKRKKANPKKWTKDLSSAWLEHSFGWTPLLADAKGAMEAWNRLFDTERLVPFTGFGSATTVDRARSGTSQVTYSNYCHAIKNVAASSSRLVKYRGKVKAEAKTGARAQLELFGLTPSEFLPTAWELLPWSFLADYFTNIGDIITAGVVDRSSIAWVARSDVAVYNYNIILYPDFPRIKTAQGFNAKGQTQLVFSDGSPGYAFWERRTVQRSASYPLVVPDLVFELPGSNSQLLNIAALLGQANALHRQRYHN